MKTTINEVKMLYKDYCEREGLGYHIEDVDKNELSLLYTMVYNEDDNNEAYAIQVNYDLKEEKMVVYLIKQFDDEIIITYKEPQSLEDFADELNDGVRWENYYSWVHEIVETRIGIPNLDF